MPRRNHSRSPSRSRSRDDHRRRRNHRSYRSSHYYPRTRRDSYSYSSESDLDIVSDYESGSGSELERRPKKHSAGGKIIKTEITGEKAETKTLFKGPRRCKCCSPWSDTIPENQDHSPKPNSAEHGEYAILIRKSSFGGMPWEIEEVTIYSKYIIDLLNDTLGDKHDWGYAFESVKLMPPYKSLIHGWTELLEAMDESEDEKAKEHYKLFRDTFQPLLQPTFDKIDEFKAKGEITFQYLWTLFTPEMLVVWKRNDQRIIGKIDEVIESYAEFTLSLDQVDWNGDSFGIARYSRQFKGYKGSKKIIELEAVPLDFFSDKDQIKKDHIEQGRKFESLAGYNYVQYDGPCWDSSWHQTAKKDIRERMVIDKFAYYYFQGLGPGHFTKVLITPPKRHVKDRNDGQPIYDRNGNVLVPPPRPISPDRGVDNIIIDDYGRGPPPPRPTTYRNKPRKSNKVYIIDEDGVEEEKPTTLNEEQLLISIPFLMGFNMREKRWYRIIVSGISPMTRTDSFANLVLPNQEKDLLLAFARSKMAENAKSAAQSSGLGTASPNGVFDDFVDSKGRGIIVLLSGPPGTGKTLTAESIADKLQVPLYTLSAGEIGTAPEKVESELKVTLDKCVMWNAILLLDEADVFLERRELNSLARNELVSIFLRQLEYYTGTMILTTNRHSAIDPAFESRIDVSIAYPELTADLRLQIWSKFLFRGRREADNVSSTGTSASVPIKKTAAAASSPLARKNIRERDLLEISELPLNGRQIKSAIKTATLLANSKDEELGIEHLRTTLKLHRTESNGREEVRGGIGQASSIPQLVVGPDGFRERSGGLKTRKEFEWNF